MSKETKWTPGPWFACRPDDLGMTVARVDKLWSVKCDEPVASGEHDAHLIAAAPELYEALAYALADYDDWVSDEDNYPHDHLVAWSDKARAALAKARGES